MDLERTIDIKNNMRREKVRLLFSQAAKKPIYALIQILVALFQLMVPARRRRVCYMSQPDFSDSSYALFRYLMINCSELEHVWIVRDYRNKKRIEQEFDFLQKQGEQPGHRLQVLRRSHPLGALRAIRAQVLFHTHGTYGFHRFSWRRMVVNVWHGMPIKCIGRLNRVTPNPFPTYGTHHIASSYFFKYIIALAFAVKEDQVILSGLPRCDVLKGFMAPRRSRTEICRLLSLDIQKKILLWMPTYRTETRVVDNDLHSFLDDMPEDLFDAIQSHCLKKGVQLVIKLHPYDYLNQTGIPGVGADVRVITAKDFQAFNVPLYDLVAASDGLISDISSILIDYLLTGKPVGVVGFSPEQYLRDLVFPPLHLLKCDQVSELSQISDLGDFIQAVVMGEISEQDDSDPAGLFNEDVGTYSCQKLAEYCGLI